jgi:hypothetical protein
MTETPQGPGWWQASDGRWYPPETHPSYQPPPGPAPGAFPPGAAYPGTPGMVQPAAGLDSAGAGPAWPGMVSPAAGPGPNTPGMIPVNTGGGVPKGLIIAGAILLVVVVGGWLTVSWALGRIGDRLGRSVAGGDCSLVSTSDVNTVLDGSFDVFELGGLTEIASPVLDARVLSDATTCWASFFFGAGHHAPSGDDGAVVAQSYPAAGHSLAVLVEDEVHGSLGAGAAFGCDVPAHEDFVVPDSHFAAPEVAALVELLGAACGCQDLQGVAALADVHLVRVDDLLAVLPRLPGGPPVAGEVDSVALATGQLIDADAEGLCDRLGYPEVRLSLASLVPADLPLVDPRGAREVG